MLWCGVPDCRGFQGITVAYSRCSRVLGTTANGVSVLGVTASGIDGTRLSIT